MRYNACLPGQEKAKLSEPVNLKPCYMRHRI